MRDAWKFSPIKDPRLDEQNRMAELQWRDHADLQTLEKFAVFLCFWILGLTLVVLL